MPHRHPLHARHARGAGPRKIVQRPLDRDRLLYGMVSRLQRHLGGSLAPADRHYRRLYGERIGYYFPHGRRHVGDGSALGGFRQCHPGLARAENPPHERQRHHHRIHLHGFSGCRRRIGAELQLRRLEILPAALQDRGRGKYLYKVLAFSLRHFGRLQPQKLHYAQFRVFQRIYTQKYRP